MLSVIDLNENNVSIPTEKDSLHFKIFLFVHFMVKILFLRSNHVQIITLFKILNDITFCTQLDL